MSTSITILLLSITSLLLASLPNSLQLENNLARTPPMGWLAWERFTCEINCDERPDDCISQKLFTDMAVRLKEDGYLAVGYNYVNIDDCWQANERDKESGRLQMNSTRFSSELRALAFSIHALGLKLGLYGDCGIKTCGGYLAQLNSPTNFSDNNFEVDAETMAFAQVDSFKFDGCYIDPLKAESICPQMARALQATSREVLLICEWPFYMMYAHVEPDFSLAAKACNAWRYYDDIEDSWSSILNTIDYTVKHQSTIVKYHGPGHWFDPDQLVIGNFGLSVEQAQAQMALWSVWAAPLYMSNDLRNIEAKFARILKNQHLIGVNQDELGVFGLMVLEADGGQFQAFVKPILPVINKCPSFALVYLNRRPIGKRTKVSFPLRDLLLEAPIHRAAKHQRIVADFKAQSAAKQSPNSTADSQSSGESSGEQIIEPRKCLARLAPASTRTPQSPVDWLALADEDHSIRYQMFDLMDGKVLGEISLADRLELYVNPSGVRAVRLQEIA